jgi:prepilin-type N-terminal cleavage/methylation domain-containing protein/prepilin-type processing-associated H-X9-DG protein
MHTSFDHSSRTRKSAFTLIELLVVIAIIAILAAILFPVFAQAKTAAKKTSSLSGTKQLALGATIYATDYDDIFPFDRGGDPGNTYYGETYVNGAMDPNAPVNWARGIHPYVRNFGIYGDAVAVDTDTTNGWGCFDPSSVGGRATQFCGSKAFNALAQNKSVTAMPEPAGTIIISDKTQKTKVSQSVPQWNFFSDASCPGVIGKPTPNRCPTGTDGPTTHMNFTLGANFGYADGHAKYAKKSAIKYSNFGWTGLCRSLGQRRPPNVPAGGSDATVTTLTGVPNPFIAGTGWTYDNWNVICEGSAF